MKTRDLLCVAAIAFLVTAGALAQQSQRGGAVGSPGTELEFAL